MTKRQTLSERLQSVPHRFDGLHALRMAELGDGDHIRAPRITAERGLAFAAAPIAAVQRSPEETRVRSALLGLTGPMGVLPQAYSELVYRAARLRNFALPAFLDVFNQRLTTLFLRASEKYRLGLQVQRNAVQRSAAIGSDPVSRAVLALAGLGTPALSGRMSVPDEAVLYYAGLFAARTRPASALQAVLTDYLGVPVEVEQFAGRWLAVGAAEQTRLTQPRDGEQFCALGVDAVAGARVWDVQSAFRVVVGPVQRAEMMDLMPDQPLLRRLVDLVRLYAGVDMVFEVQVIVHRDSIPELQMNSTPGPAAPRLGWNTWAKHLPALEHSRDILLDPDIVARPPARTTAGEMVTMDVTHRAVDPARAARQTR